MKFRSIIICVLMGFCASSGAQSPMDDYIRHRDSIQAEYDKYRNRTIADYEHFRDSCNAEYAKFLKEAWKPFKGNKGVEAPKEDMHLPKDVLEQMKNPPKKMPVRTEESEEAAFNVRDAIISVRDFFKRLKPAKPMVERRQEKERIQKQDQEPKQERNQEQNQKQIADSPIQKPDVNLQIQKENENRLVRADEPIVNLMPFDFYGTKMQVDMGNLRDVLKLKDPAPNNVSEVWKLCSEKQYVSLIEDCLSLKDKHHFGDWAYLQMIKTMADKAFGSNTNESTFLTAYIYCQSGYRIRLGRDGDRLLMLFTTHHCIYNRDYWLIDNQEFYSLQESERLSSIDVCDKAINAMEQPLSLWMTEPIMLDERPSKTRLIQSDRYPEMRMEVKVNENLIQYYNDYPNSRLGSKILTKWAIYANTPLNKEVENQILQPLQEQLQGLPEDEQICRLLSLIQPRDKDFGTAPETSLQYEYDDSIWGRDRIFFPEETLYYPYSDCEDHAILFARLVRDLVGLEVLLVYYSAPGSVGGHLATAVHFNQKPTMGNGDALIYDDKTYYVCDPTNWDPRPGVTMRGMNNRAAQVILIN